MHPVQAIHKFRISIVCTCTCVNLSSSIIALSIGHARFSIIICYIIDFALILLLYSMLCGLPHIILISNSLYLNALVLHACVQLPILLYRLCRYIMLYIGTSKHR